MENLTESLINVTNYIVGYVIDNCIVTAVLISAIQNPHQEPHRKLTVVCVLKAIMRDNRRRRE